MQFIIGDSVNGQETSQEIIDSDNYTQALEILVSASNLYCRKATEKELKELNYN
jgi:hypothetical protein